MRNPVPLLAALSVFALAGVAHADYDISGRWLVLDPAGTPTVRLDLTQSTGTLSEPTSPTSIGWVGTIDEGSGVFELDSTQQPSIPFCSPWLLDGTVTADGKSFTGTLVKRLWVSTTAAGGYCGTFPIAVTGTRCGNFEIDDGEDCDLGDVTNGDCCSSSCIYDPDATACSSDENVCTEDVCDAAGVCEHNATTGACAGPHGCGTGDCTDGECVVSSFTPAGTSCDRDSSICTADTCDGAGVCTGGSVLSCEPCGECDAEFGCVRPAEDYCFGTPDAISLSTSVDEDPNRNKLKLKYEDSPFDLLGSPTDDASYSICLYADDGVADRVVLQASIPPGGTCGDEDCWQLKGSTFKYKDRNRSVAGIGSMSVRSSKVQARGAGANLGFGLSLPTTSTLTAGVVVTDGVWRECWTHEVSIQQQTTTKLKARYRP